MGRLIYDESESTEGYDIREEIYKYLKGSTGGVFVSGGTRISILLSEVGLGISLFLRDGQ